MHNLIYYRLVTDGDSSVYKKLREADPYAEYDIDIEKVECSKHLRRAFRNRAKDIASSKRGYVGKLRQIVQDSEEKCIGELNHLLQYDWDQDKEIDDEMCEEVVNAIHVIPRHVFGDHSECAASHLLCDGVSQKNEENIVSTLEQWDYVTEVEEVISRLSRPSRSLLLNFDTNLVESANAIVAEKIGGKRINYALRNEYTVRVLTAALQFNTRQVTILYYKFAGKTYLRLQKL